MSLLSSVVARLVVAKYVAKQMDVDANITAIRLYLQLGNDGDTFELGNITVSNRHSSQEIRTAIQQLLSELAERWK